MQMNRRDILKSTAGLGAAAMMGLAPRGASAQGEVPSWLDKLYKTAIANNEKTVVYYPTSPGQERIIEKFHQLFPEVQVQYKYTIASELTAIVDAEFASGNRTIDVLQGGPTLQLGLRASDRQGKFEVPADSGIPSSAIFFDGHMFSNGRLLYALGYNTARVKPEEIPDDLSELLEGEWRSRVAMQKPVGAGGGDNAMTTLRVAGFLPDEMIQKLVGLPTENGQVALCTAVAQGKYDAALWTSSTSVLAVASKGAPIKQHVLPKYSALQNDVISLLRDPPHPHAANLFLGYLLSEVGQEEAGTFGLYSIYDSMPAPESFPDISAIQVPMIEYETYFDQSKAMREITIKYWP